PLSKKVQELVDALAEHRQALLDAVSELDEAQFAYRPADDAWSINDILHHLALSDEANAKLAFRALKHARERNIAGDATPDASVLNRLDGIFTPISDTKAQAPERVVPREHLAADQSIARLHTSRTNALEAIEQLAAYDLTQLKYPHPMLGDLDMYQWL